MFGVVKRNVFSLGSSASHWILERFTEGQRFVILCVLVGMICGVVAVLFHWAIHGLFDFVWACSVGSGPYLYAVMPLVPALGGLVVGFCLHYLSPSSAGSGIPTTKAAYYNHFGIIRLRQGIMRFFLCTISVGTGASLGREGPTVHICAAIASAVGRVFGLAKSRLPSMIPVGMGAGIASAFNTPLSAITFVFEELLEDFSSKALGGILLAVVISAAVSRMMLGESPAFTIEPYEFDSLAWMWISPILGLLSAFIGEWFVRLLLSMREKVKDSKIPPVYRPALAGLSVGVLGTAIFAVTKHHGIFSIGYEDLNQALAGNLALDVVVILLIGKFFSGLISYSSGAPGGLFGPVLFIGGMFGGAAGLVLQTLFGFSQDMVGAMALLGMGAFFAAVIRCPITSILIMFEMTLNYEIILPLMIGNMIAFYTATKMRSVPIYNALLTQDKINLRKMPGYQGGQDWKSLPVSTIMTYDVRHVREDKTIQEALDRVRNDMHHGYPVLNEENVLSGVITHHELEETTTKQRAQPVRTLMGEERRLITVTPKTSIREAARILVIEDVLQAPVVSVKNSTKILGIITLHDIARQQNAIEE